MALPGGVPDLRKPLANTLVGALILAISLAVVGLTASADRPFTISVQPAFLRLGVEVDIKVGRLHLHASWSALDSASTSRDAG